MQLLQELSPFSIHIVHTTESNIIRISRIPQVKPPCKTRQFPIKILTDHISNDRRSRSTLRQDIFCLTTFDYLHSTKPSHNVRYLRLEVKWRQGQSLPNP